MLERDLESALKGLYLSIPAENRASEALFDAAAGASKMFKCFGALLTERRLPERGWNRGTIEAFLHWISGMDSNNFEGVIGVGEREGRVFSSLVKERHFGFAHGMGRSGNLRDGQPKAIGSTLVAHLSTLLARDALRCLGWKCFKHQDDLGIVPVCTGMAMTLGLLAMKRPLGRKVIWCRVDQKSCFKAILAAGLEVLVVEGRWEGDELQSDLKAIEEAITSHPPGEIHSIVSCLTCFAPRVPDSVCKIGNLAEKYGIPHLINAAYGAASQAAINQANNAKFDLLVMSLDKNFMVPVGGAIVCGPLASAVMKMYPGRAALTPSLDLLITLLEMGRGGLKAMKEERAQLFLRLKNELLAGGFRVLQTPRNDISMAIALDGQDSGLGSKLFYRNVTGARLVTAGKRATVDGHAFENWCAHSSQPKFQAYLNVAVAVGFKSADISTLLRKLQF